jgi:hypothetical protein
VTLAAQPLVRLRLPAPRSICACSCSAARDRVEITVDEYVESARLPPFKAQIAQ